MRICYLSAASTNALIDRIRTVKGKDPGYAVQKFNKLIIKGLIENSCKIVVLSNAPVDSRSHPGLIFSGKEKEDGIQYNYTPIINRKGIKQLSVFLYTFFKILSFGITKRNEKAVVCDALSISQSMAAVFAGFITRLKIVGIITDMPGLMVTTESSKVSFVKRIKKRVITCVNKVCLNHFTHYVLLTEAMNPIMNPSNKPHIVMEGLCDPQMSDFKKYKKFENKTIMYAGGLHEKYGLKTLTESFMKIDDPNIRLLIYGSGPYSDELIRLSKLDSRIQYKGLAPNAEVVAAELKSFLLVNPRPTTEEFTKYSFPSKNMEYMASGTPLLTTKLPGMPTEYYPYVYLFANESIDGYKNKIERILSLNNSEVELMGINAKEWVLRTKNYKAQAKRILNCISK